MFDLELTEEQRLLEQSVREWAGREVAPRIRELDREHRFDPAILTQMADLGLLGMCVPRGVRRRRHGLPELRAGVRGDRVRRHVAARDPVGAPRPELADRVDLGHGGPETALPGAAGRGTEDRQLRAYRAGCGQRRPRAADRGRQARGPVRAHRREDVDIARRRRGSLPGVRLQRPREEAEARRFRDSARSWWNAASRGSRAEP